MLRVIKDIFNDEMEIRPSGEGVWVRLEDKRSVVELQFSLNGIDDIIEFLQEVKEYQENKPLGFAIKEK